MRMTLEEIIDDAIMLGYDFGELITRKENKFNYKEYIYGYSLADDKLGYLEAMAKNEVMYCDRIKYFEEELQDCLAEMEKLPHSKIISGFFESKNFKDEYDEFRVSSTFRIILLDEHNRKAIAKDFEYIDDGDSEVLCVYIANLYYVETMDELNINGLDSLFKNVEDFTTGFCVEDQIQLN